MNFCTFTGNLVSDPELRYTPSGVAVCDFNLAVEKKYKDKNGKLIKQTVFPRFQAWSSGAETIAKHFQKGDSMTITNATYREETYQDKDGNNRKSYSFRVNDFEFPRFSKRQMEERLSRMSSNGDNNNGGGFDVNAEVEEQQEEVAAAF